jgi:hypothetical protein
MGLPIGLLSACANTPINQVVVGQPMIPAVTQEAIVVNRNLLGEVSHQEHEDERLIREQRRARLSARQYRQPTLNCARREGVQYMLNHDASQQLLIIFVIAVDLQQQNTKAVAALLEQCLSILQLIVQQMLSVL